MLTSEITTFFWPSLLLTEKSSQQENGQRYVK